MQILVGDESSTKNMQLTSGSAEHLHVKMTASSSRDLQHLQDVPVDLEDEARPLLDVGAFQHALGRHHDHKAYGKETSVSVLFNSMLWATSKVKLHKMLGQKFSLETKKNFSRKWRWGVQEYYDKNPHEIVEEDAKNMATRTSDSLLTHHHLEVEETPSSTATASFSRAGSSSCKNKRASEVVSKFLNIVPFPPSSKCTSSSTSTAIKNSSTPTPAPSTARVGDYDFHPLSPLRSPPQMKRTILILQEQQEVVEEQASPPPAPDQRQALRQHNFNNLYDAQHEDEMRGNHLGQVVLSSEDFKGRNHLGGTSSEEHKIEARRRAKGSKGQLLRPNKPRSWSIFGHWLRDGAVFLLLLCGCFGPIYLLTQMMSLSFWNTGKTTTAVTRSVVRAANATSASAREREMWPPCERNTPCGALVQLVGREVHSDPTHFIDYRKAAEAQKKARPSAQGQGAGGVPETESRSFGGKKDPKITRIKAAKAAGIAASRLQSATSQGASAATSFSDGANRNGRQKHRAPMKAKGPGAKRDVASSTATGAVVSEVSSFSDQAQHPGYRLTTTPVPPTSSGRAGRRRRRRAKNHGDPHSPGSTTPHGSSSGTGEHQVPVVEDAPPEPKESSEADKGGHNDLFGGWALVIVATLCAATAVSILGMLLMIFCYCGSAEVEEDDDGIKEMTRQLSHQTYHGGKMQTGHPETPRAPPALVPSSCSSSDEQGPSGYGATDRGSKVSRASRTSDDGYTIGATARGSKVSRASRTSDDGYTIAHPSQSSSRSDAVDSMAPVPGPRMPRLPGLADADLFDGETGGSFNANIPVPSVSMPASSRGRRSRVPELSSPSTDNTSAPARSTLDRLLFRTPSPSPDGSTSGGKENKRGSRSVSARRNANSRDGDDGAADPPSPTRQRRSGKAKAQAGASKAKTAKRSASTISTKNKKGKK